MRRRLRRPSIVTSRRRQLPWRRPPWSKTLPRLGTECLRDDKVDPAPSRHGVFPGTAAPCEARPSPELIMPRDAAPAQVDPAPGGTECHSNAYACVRPLLPMTRVHWVSCIMLGLSATCATLAAYVACWVAYSLRGLLLLRRSCSQRRSVSLMPPVTANPELSGREPA